MKSFQLLAAHSISMLEITCNLALIALAHFSDRNIYKLVHSFEGKNILILGAGHVSVSDIQSFSDYDLIICINSAIKHFAGQKFKELHPKIIFFSSDPYWTFRFQNLKPYARAFRSILVLSHNTHRIFIDIVKQLLLNPEAYLTMAIPFFRTKYEHHPLLLRTDTKNLWSSKRPINYNPPCSPRTNHHYLNRFKLFAKNRFAVLKYPVANSAVSCFHLLNALSTKKCLLSFKGCHFNSTDGYQKFCTDNDPGGVNGLALKIRKEIPFRSNTRRLLHLLSLLCYN